MSAFIVDIRKIKDTQQGKQIWPYRPQYIFRMSLTKTNRTRIEECECVTARGYIYMERTDATNFTCALIGDGIKEQRH